MERQSQWKGFMDVLFLGAVGIGKKTAREAYNGQGPVGLSYLVLAKQELKFQSIYIEIRNPAANIGRVNYPLGIKRRYRR